MPGGRLVDLNSWIISPLMLREMIVLSEELNPLDPQVVFVRWFTSLG